MRRPPRRDQCPLVSEETATCRQPHSDDGQTFRKILSFLEVHAVKNSVRYHQALQELLQHTSVAENPLVADAEVDEALVAFFNQKYRVVYSSSTGDIQLGAKCHYFPEFGKYGGHFLPRCHRMCGAYDSTDSGFFAARPLEHGHLPAVDGDVQLQARGATVHSERRHPNSYTRNELPVIKCFFTQKTDR